MATEWKKVRLGDIADYVSEKISIARVDPKDYISTENMLANKNGITICSTIPDVNSVSKYNKYDILVSNIRPYFKKIWYAIHAGGCSNDVIIFRVKNTSKTDSKYLYYLLSQDSFFDYMMAGANGTKMPRGNKKLIPNFKAIDFNFSTQQKIAGILSAYDDLIENNRKQIKLLEEAAQKLYKEWFVKLNFPGHENVKIIDGVPEGWIETDINSICTKINAGGTPNRKKTEYWNNKDVKWFKTKELQDCWLYDSEEYLSQKGLENSSAKIFPENTILMAIYASPTLGRLGILTNEACCNQAALCMIANEEIISYQWLYLKLLELREYFNSVARGAGQQNISADVVKNKNIVLPPKSLLDNFTKIIEPYFDKIKSLQNQIQLLQSARDKLLPTLMKGDIDV